MTTRLTVVAHKVSIVQPDNWVRSVIDLAEDVSQIVHKRGLSSALVHQLVYYLEETPYNNHMNFPMKVSPCELIQDSPQRAT